MKKINQTTEEQRLYNLLKKQAKIANQRILRLEREFGKNAWGVKYLKQALEIEPLQAWTPKGRIKVSKKFNETQLNAILKATDKFIKAKAITTKRGIEQTRKKAIENLRTRFSVDAKEMTYEETEALYEIFEDKEVNRITAFIPRLRCNRNY